MPGCEKFVEYIKKKLKNKTIVTDIPKKLIMTAVECAEYKRDKKFGKNDKCHVNLDSRIEKLFIEYESTNHLDLKTAHSLCDTVRNEFLLKYQMKKNDKLQRQIFTASVDVGVEHELCLNYR